MSSNRLSIEFHVAIQEEPRRRASLELNEEVGFSKERLQLSVSFVFFGRREVTVVETIDAGCGAVADYSFGLTDRFANAQFTHSSHVVKELGHDVNAGETLSTQGSSR